MKNQNPNQNSKLIEIKSVGSVIDTDSGNIYPLNQDGTVDFTFGISFRLSSVHPAFRILSYISGTVYPVYNLSKRLIKARKKFRESSFYLNLSDFIVGFIISIIGIEAFNLMSDQLENIIIDTNSIYYFLKLYTILTIISLFYTFKRPEECLIKKI